VNPEGAEGLIGFAHRFRRPVALAVYAALTAGSLALAVLLRSELTWPPDQSELYWLALPWLILLRSVLFWSFRLTSGRWRFVGVSDVGRLGAAVAAGTAAYFALAWGASVLPALPRSVLLIEGMLTLLLISAVWLAYRLTFEGLQRARHGNGRRRRVLMVGAGDAGQMLVREMQRTPTGLLPVGYVDDDPVKWGTRIHGVKVRGKVEDLPTLVDRHRVDEVVIAIPSAEPVQIRRIVELCDHAGRPFSILPGIAEVFSGEAHLSQVREVRVEDLLGREPVVMRRPEIGADLEGKVVMITGAAGSIGSELSRQVALHGPASLVLVDQAETPLYYLELELKAEFSGLDLVPLVLDVADGASVERAFERYRPDRVFHAAAYKHVPMMERHPLEAVRNNVLGTWVVSDAAGRTGVGKFVLVSTDKAVQPASVMGASKRLAELVVLEAQRLHPHTDFGAVRFGNVLGSNGSVLPLFRKQLREGRPLTVTHEDVTRYFMTIPEAVQLILKASRLSELRGHIAMLEMGEPVRILDMARNFLRLAGTPYRPGENIVFTGLRPGEKMQEELVGPEERVLSTDLEKVRLVVSVPPDAKTGSWLSPDELSALRRHDADEVLAVLFNRFPAVAPQSEEGAVPAPAR
jgi:FlaA1/EpsC-like NDP-sugar epimerase